MVYQFEPPYAVEAKGYVKKNFETAVYRHFKFADKLLAHPPGIFTMWQMYLHSSCCYADRQFLGTRRKEGDSYKEYEWETHRQVKDHIENFGKGLASLGLQRQCSLGVYSINRREWTISEIASYREAFIIVALYDTLGTEAMGHIINETEMEYIIASADKVSNILDIMATIPKIKYIISMDESVDSQDLYRAKGLGVAVYTFKQVEKLGAECVEESEMPSGDDIATICYTSGTTGVPKGAVITQANCVASTFGVSHVSEIGCFASVNESDVYISYLPMAHVFERVAQGFVLFMGAAIGYYHGDTVGLMDDIYELKPTIFVSVPRLFNRIYDKVLAGVNAKGGLSKYLFNMAYNAKKNNLNNSVHHWVYDRLVFNSVRQKLGGKIRFILSGSAPIAPEVLAFLKICFSATVHEGYGQTENYCSGALTIVGDNTPGVVGAPFPCSEIKLVDVPDMKYLSTDLPYPRGEICIRGNGVMKEYYKNPDKTAEAIDSEGWLHTGDIGLFDEAKRLAIIDRLKNIFKLSQGEYIAPEKIESIYQKNELITQAFVYGDSMQSQLVGVFVPDKVTFTHWASKKPEFASMSFEALCASPEVNAEVLTYVSAFGKTNNLKGFEQVKALYLSTEEFTIENELLTPTFKLKRELVQNLYQDQINNMYNALTNGRRFT
ncbi:hypothetical protein [Parasitella parasitica]|uniref:AMP-dependent synthetase/ligase domain-containing protein n=1 Tax=Parasitella parasitica TaxID=35722 RepID=A0A0B7MYR8_9FUNG|nr:hypothetical protein [Parasitella parasitica]